MQLNRAGGNATSRGFMATVTVAGPRDACSNCNRLVPKDLLGVVCACMLRA